MTTLITQDNGRLNETDQHVDLAFSNVKKRGEDYVCIHRFFHCREYLAAQLIATRDKIELKEHVGQKGDGINAPINLRKLTMAISSDTINTLVGNIRLLQEWERSVGLTPTTLSEFHAIEGPEKRPLDEVRLLVASPRWLSNNIVYSLYTHILRCLVGYPSKRGETLDKLLSRIANQGGNGCCPKLQNKIIDSTIDIKFLVKNVTKIRRSSRSATLADYEDLSEYTSNMACCTGISAAAYLLNEDTEDTYNSRLHMKAIGGFIDKYKEVANL